LVVEAVLGIALEEIVVGHLFLEAEALEVAVELVKVVIQILGALELLVKVLLVEVAQLVRHMEVEVAVAQVLQALLEHQVLVVLVEMV
jgi:hypothetical protein